MVAAQETAYLEMFLAMNMNIPENGLHFRNLAWEGDTVYEQPRELNFGSWEDQLRRVHASVIVAQFGQSESLEGKQALPRFIQAYEKLLDAFAVATQRIILWSPTPFETSQSLVPDLSNRNEDLRSYVEAIRTLARKRGYLFVDLFSNWRGAEARSSHFTRDGLHLNARGHWLAAREFLKQVGLKEPSSIITVDPESGVVSPPNLEQLRKLIREKNRLWFDYWRPMNWAFLRGDRIEQPSSRDHRNPTVRWFPLEMEKFLPLIQEKETEIGKVARDARQSATVNPEK
jgi:hypothetical protein